MFRTIIYIVKKRLNTNRNIHSFKKIYFNYFFQQRIAMLRKKRYLISKND